MTVIRREIFRFCRATGVRRSTCTLDDSTPSVNRATEASYLASKNFHKKTGVSFNAAGRQSGGLGVESNFADASTHRGQVERKRESLSLASQIEARLDEVACIFCECTNNVTLFFVLSLSHSVATPSGVYSPQRCASALRMSSRRGVTACRSADVSSNREGERNFPSLPRPPRTPVLFLRFPLPLHDPLSSRLFRHPVHARRLERGQTE